MQIDIWLVWFIAACSTALLELMIPGFFMLSVSIGCLGGMAASLFSLDGTWQVAIGLSAMVLFMAFIRPLLYATKKDQGIWGRSRLIGEAVTVTKDILPPAKGRALLSGIEWDAESKEQINAGEAAYIESVGGATLYLTKENPLKKYK